MPKGVGGPLGQVSGTVLRVGARHGDEPRVGTSRCHHARQVGPVARHRNPVDPLPALGRVVVQQGHGRVGALWGQEHVADDPGGAVTVIEDDDAGGYFGR